MTACRLSVYELGGNGKETLNLDNAYYTDINPEDFYDSQNILGTKAYTAVDLSVKDSIRNLSTYVPSVRQEKLKMLIRNSIANYSEKLFKESTLRVTMVMELYSI